ncbi:MAG: zinc ABC transporter permease [Candidatus Hydrogenedentota bacterium]
MLEPFSPAFMQRALIGGALVGFISGYFGVFIVQRRMAFLGSGLAHAAFGGVALGILIDASPLWVALPFTVVVALAIVWIRERTALAEDTAIGVLFAVSMALGIVFISIKEGFAGDAFAYLFGSILAVSRQDLILAAATAILSICTFPLWRAWAYASFDRNLARTDRHQVIRHDFALAAAMAVAVVVSIKLVGIVLIAAFLVLPAASARVVSKTFRQMTMLSVLIGVISPLIGLYVSYFANLPSGATIILMQAALFVAALGVKRLASA